MENIKIEKWLDHEIRFVEIDNEWWAISKDIAEALGYKNTTDMVRMLDGDQKGVHNVHTPGGKQKMSIVTEIGIYKLAFKSRRKEADEFTKFAAQVIKELRKASGLESYEVFKMMQKEYHHVSMDLLKQGLPDVTKQEFMKCHTIANKATSTHFGFNKMLKVEDMIPEMIAWRQPVLLKTARLMVTNREYDMNLSISQSIYTGKLIYKGNK